MSHRSFVTGATGQIGFPLVKALVAAGHRVTALVRDEGKAAAVREAGATLLVGHLEDQDSLDRGIGDATHVWHLAGGIRGPGSMSADRLNHQGTQHVCESARKHKGNLECFVYASSCAVYGDRSGLWVGEDYAPAAATNYGKAKVAAEALLNRAAREEKLPVRIARIAAVYGAETRFTQAESIRAGKAWLPGEGRNIVPVIHVDDCVAALLAIGERGANGETYNVGAPSTPTLKEFYGEVHRIVGGKPVTFFSTWVPSPFQRIVATQNEAIMARLGRKPRFTNDNLRLFTASVRLKLDRLEKELGFAWKYGDYREGLAAALGSAKIA